MKIYYPQLTQAVRQLIEAEASGRGIHEAEEAFAAASLAERGACRISGGAARSLALYLIESAGVSYDAKKLTMRLYEVAQLHVATIPQAPSPRMGQRRNFRKQ